MAKRNTVFAQNEISIISEEVNVTTSSRATFTANGAQVLTTADEPFPSVTTIIPAPVGAAPNANGLTVTGGDTLNLQPADYTHPGVLVPGNQSLGSGIKQFDQIQLTNAAILSGTANVTVNASALNLNAAQITTNTSQLNLTSGSTVDVTLPSLTNFKANGNKVLTTLDLPPPFPTPVFGAFYGDASGPPLNANTPFPFPFTTVLSGGMLRASASGFTVPSPGFYEVSVQASIIEAGGIVAELNGVGIPQSQQKRDGTLSQVSCAFVVEVLTAFSDIDFVVNQYTPGSFTVAAATISTATIKKLS